MKITGLETYVVGSAHRNFKRHWLILKLTTDEGICGLGEASLHVFDDHIIGMLRDWTQFYLIGRDPMPHQEHWLRFYHDTGYVRGGGMASSVLSGIDIALWDLKGKILNRPIHELLGGPVRNEIRVYANGWYTNPASPEQIADEARATVSLGYDALKFDPFGVSSFYTIALAEAELAERRVAAVREAVGPHVDLLIEGHAKFSAATALHLGRRLAPYRPTWFEDPVAHENLSELAYVRQHLEIPIAVGEKAFTKFPYFEMLKAEAIDFAQPDVCNVGGITELMKVAAMCEARHVMLAPHNTNSPIGTGASFSAAAAIPNFLIQEYHCEFYESWFFDLCSGQPRRSGNHVALPTGSGLGIVLNEEVARRHPLVQQPLSLRRRNI